MPRRWQREAIGPGVLFLVLAILFYPLWHGAVLGPSDGQLLPPFSPPAKDPRPDLVPFIAGLFGDVWRWFGPMQSFIHESVRAGELPQWNPYIYGGAPVLGNGQSAVFHPLNWIYFFIAPVWARGPTAVLRLWISGTAIILLARRLRLSVFAAFLVGLIWSLSAASIRWLAWTSISTAALWLPVLLVALDGFLVRPTLRAWAGATIVALILQLSGHPETQLLVGIAAGVFTLGRLWDLRLSPRPFVGRTIGSLLVVGIGLVGAAVGLLPFFMELLDSVDWAENLHRTPGHLAFEAWKTIIAPDHFGRDRGLNAYRGPIHYNFVGFWVGLLPLALAFAALGGQPRRRRGLVRCLWFLWLTSWLIGFGVPGLTQAWESIPVLRLCSAFYFQFAGAFAASLLAGLGFDQLRRKSHVTAGRRFVTALGVMVALRLWLYLDRQWGATQKVTQKILLHGFDCLMLHDRGVLNLGGTLLGMIGLLLVVWTWRRERHRLGPTGRWVFSAVALLELVWVARDYNPLGPRALIEPRLAELPKVSALRTALGSQRCVALDDMLFPNQGMTYGLRDFRGYDYPMPRRLGRVLRHVGLELAFTRIPHRLLEPTIPEALAVLLDRFAVKGILAPPSWYLRQRTTTAKQPVFWSSLVLPGIPKDGSVNAFYNSDALPRAYLARHFRRVDAERAFQALFDRLINPEQLAFVEGPIPDAPPAAALGAARIIPELDRANLVGINVTAPQGGLVVLADRMAPGWRVYVDGREAPAVTVHYLFRGVMAPPGNHQIVWRYETPGLRLGAGISAFTMLLLLGFVALPVRRSRVV